MSERVTPEQIEEAGLDDWRRLYHALQARFRTGDFATGLRLVNEIGGAAELARERIDATVAAGGTVVDEQPTYVVLADPDGNRACVCF